MFGGCLTNPCDDHSMFAVCRPGHTFVALSRGQVRDAFTRWNPGVQLKLSVLVEFKTISFVDTLLYILALLLKDF